MTVGWPIDFIGAAGATNSLCWLPQAIKVIREKETRALSLPVTGAFTAGVLLWLIYGGAIDDWPLIGSNGATLALMLPILAISSGTAKASRHSVRERSLCADRVALCRRVYLFMTSRQLGFSCFLFSTRH